MPLRSEAVNPVNLVNPLTRLTDIEDININYHEFLINFNLWLIGTGFDGFASVHRFSSDLHFKTLPSIIDGLWQFMLKQTVE